MQQTPESNRPLSKLAVEFRKRSNIDYLTPVIVGVGQVLDRPAENEVGLEPLKLIT
jgi:hypothetical protein